MDLDNTTQNQARASRPTPGPANSQHNSDGDPAQLHDFIEAIAEKIEKQDPVVPIVRQMTEDQIKNGEIEIPRLPDIAARILQYAQDPDASAKDVINEVRVDPVLAGKVIEIANSALFAGSHPVFNLQMAVVRLGINRVGEAALQLSVNMNAFQKDKRSNMLTRLWKFSVATGFASEEFARQTKADDPETAFLTGIFHAIASPAIVGNVGKLERQGEIPPQSDSRILGLLDQLSNPLTEKIVRGWKLPKTAQEAVRLQTSKVRDRRNKPLAHLLQCAKEVTTELGIGVRPQPIDLQESRDFKFIGIEDLTQLDPVRAVVQDKMTQLTRA